MLALPDTAPTGWNVTGPQPPGSVWKDFSRTGGHSWLQCICASTMCRGQRQRDLILPRCQMWKTGPSRVPAEGHRARKTVHQDCEAGIPAPPVPTSMASASMCFSGTAQLTALLTITRSRGHAQKGPEGHRSGPSVSVPEPGAPAHSDCMSVTSHQCGCPVFSQACLQLGSGSL